MIRQKDPFKTFIFGTASRPKTEPLWQRSKPRDEDANDHEIFFTVELHARLMSSAWHDKSKAVPSDTNERIPRVAFSLPIFVDVKLVEG